MEAQQSSNAIASMEDMRQRGVRPKMPAYHETPLLSVGKLVRVQVAPGRCRRALVECVDEGDGTVDVVFVRARRGAVHEEEDQEEEEATLAATSVRPLEDCEIGALVGDRPQAFQDDLFGAAAAAKEGGNALFKLGDLEAAAELYGKAIDELEQLRALASVNEAQGDPDQSCWVLVNKAGTLLPGTVVTADAAERRADVELRSSEATEVISGAPWRVLVKVQLGQLSLQGSLHLNRARALSQAAQHQEAAQDLSMVIALWAAFDAAGGVSAESDRRDQLTKAFYLRAKTRLARLRIEPARADLQNAWNLEPPEATVKLLRQLERELEVAQREKVRSNKKLAKEIAKLADTAMAGLDASQLAAFGGSSAVS